MGWKESTERGTRADSSGVVFSALLPHPPIVVPAVGGARIEGCRATLDACRDLARRMTGRKPNRVILPTPHAPRRTDAFGLRLGDRLTGDLERFGAPSAGVDLPYDAELSAALHAAARDEGVATWTQPDREPLDHGACVPLFFLAEAGWQGPTTIVSLPWNGKPEIFERFGRACAAASADVGGSTAFIASGDMSHRVLPDAPAGFNPRAVEFDQRLTDLVRAGRQGEISRIDPELRELAAEDAADTSIMAAAAAGFRTDGHEVLSYEHPFGVGYLVAVFFDGDHVDSGQVDSGQVDEDQA